MVPTAPRGALMAENRGATLYTVTLSICVQSQRHSLSSRCHVVHSRIITLSLFTQSLSHCHAFTVTLRALSLGTHSLPRCPCAHSHSSHTFTVYTVALSHCYNCIVHFHHVHCDTVTKSHCQSVSLSVCETVRESACDIVSKAHILTPIFAVWL